MTEVLGRIRAAAERAITIGADLVAWCKSPVQLGQQISREWLALAPLLEGLAAEHEVAARAKGITLEADLAAAAGLEVHSNRTRLDRIIGNLLSNGVRYTSAGRVRLAAAWKKAAGADVLALSVEDTGSGLTQEEQDSIFQPYQRGKAGLADSDPSGSGVGLATVDRLVTDLGMALEVFSQGPGRGSRFELLVPAELLRRVA
jgi:two-component system capsular synthesis sensor histidine kinase RcsC